LHADDAGAEGRVPASRLCVGGQRERVVGHPQDVDPFEQRDREGAPIVGLGVPPPVRQVRLDQPTARSVGDRCGNGFTQ
jgi:hypothetical protein